MPDSRLNSDRCQAESESFGQCNLAAGHSGAHYCGTVRCTDCGNTRPQHVVDCPVCDVPSGHVHGRCSTPAEHDPLTCELCHAEGVSAEIAALKAENEALGALINSWALVAINGADRLQLANAMLDQGATQRFIDRANAEDDEIERLTKALQAIIDKDSADPGYEASPDYWAGLAEAVNIAQSALASTTKEASDA